MTTNTNTNTSLMLLAAALLVPTMAACGDAGGYDGGFEDTASGDSGEELPDEGGDVNDADGDGGVASGSGGGSDDGAGADALAADEGGGGNDDETGEPVAVCEPVDVELVTEQNYGVGFVVAIATEDRLSLELVTSLQWDLRHVNVDVDREAPSPNPWSYPISEPLDYAKDYSVSIPLDSVQCGDRLRVAVHAEVSRPLANGECKTKSAWAKGAHDFGVGWGSYFVVEVCCE